MGRQASSAVIIFVGYLAFAGMAGGVSQIVRGTRRDSLLSWWPWMGRRFERPISTPTASPQHAVRPTLRMPRCCFSLSVAALTTLQGRDAAATCRGSVDANGRRRNALQSLSSCSGGDVDQSETPLIDALEAAAGAVRAPFFFPGHRMGSGAGAVMTGRVMPRSTLALDLPEDVEGIDCLISSSSDGPIR